MKIGITGINGKMGKNIALEILEQGLTLSSALIESKYAENGMDLGEFLNQKKTNTFITDDVEKLFELSDIIIDFSAPLLTMKCAELASKMNKMLISGTTGLKDEELNKIKELAKNCKILWSSNMSVGVNLLMKIIGNVANVLNDYDAEIIETHHREKKDAPSGTALSFGKAIASGRNQDFNTVCRKTREGIIGARTNEEIGFSTIRAGNIAGEHTIMFAKGDEIIEFSHKAISRKIFVQGVMKALFWMEKQNKNGFYTMQDILFS